MVSLVASRSQESLTFKGTKPLLTLGCVVAIVGAAFVELSCLARVQLTLVHHLVAAHGLGWWDVTHACYLDACNRVWCNGVLARKE